MTWYTGTCGSNGYGLTIHVSFMIKCVCYTRLWIHWFRDHGVTIPNGSIITRQTSLVGVGYSRSNSIVPLKLRTICYTIGPLGQHQPYWEWVISQVDHTIELWLLFTSYAYSIYYTYITYKISYHDGIVFPY
jgi:hypothetical protein